MLAQASVLARCTAAVRGCTGIAGCAAAALAPSASAWWWPAVLLNGVWTAVFVRTALRRGLTGPLVAGEAAVTAGLALGQRWVLPPGALPDGVSWIAVILTSSMVVVNVARPARRAVPICTGLLVAHLVGARWAGAADGGIGSAMIHAIQIVSLALLMTLVRRAATLADDVLAALSLERQVSAGALARRREEAVRSDELHNTVLATLTVVATGGITSSTPRLRQQSAIAAAVLESLRLRREGGPGAGRAAAPDQERPAVTVHRGPSRRGSGLADRLQAVADAAAVDVELHLVPVAAPDEVAEALAGAVEESLANVARHAGVARATVRVSVPGVPGTAGVPVPGEPAGGEGVLVEVSDGGAGFDPDAVPPHRYGLRHAVVGAMRRVGGSARVESSAGLGTRIVLRWPE